MSAPAGNGSATPAAGIAAPTPGAMGVKVPVKVPMKVPVKVPVKVPAPAPAAAAPAAPKPKPTVVAAAPPAAPPASAPKRLLVPAAPRRLTNEDDDDDLGVLGGAAAARRAPAPAPTAPVAAAKQPAAAKPAPVAPAKAAPAKAAPAKAAAAPRKRARSPSPSASSSRSGSDRAASSVSVASSGGDPDDRETLFERAERLGLVPEDLEAALAEEAKEATLNAPPVLRFPSDIAAALVRARAQVTKLEALARMKDDNKEVSLSTSKINYIDPRICCSWAVANGVPLAKIYPKTILKKFPWAVNATNYTF